MFTVDSLKHCRVCKVVLEAKTTWSHRGYPGVTFCEQCCHVLEAERIAQAIHNINAPEPSTSGSIVTTQGAMDPINHTTFADLMLRYMKGRDRT